MQDKGHSLLVVGSVNMDLVMQLDRAPQAGENLPGREYSYVPGGKGANQAVAYANAAGALTVMRLGAQPSLPTTREVREFIRARGLEIVGD